MRNMLDELGDIFKELESAETSRVLENGLPFSVRLDGRAFSKFTKNMVKPYDERLGEIMKSVASHLLRESKANMAYVQSDEITLIFDATEDRKSILFGGRIFKLTSVLASIATSKFVALALKEFASECERSLPVFDARIFQVQNRKMASEVLLWRSIDCERNSVSMLAQSHFKHSELQDKSVSEMMRMINASGISYDSMPNHFKFGTFLQSRDVLRQLTDEELSKIPEQYRPSGPVLRSYVHSVIERPWRLVENPEQVIFEKAVPVYKDVKHFTRRTNP